MKLDYINSINTEEYIDKIISCFNAGKFVIPLNKGEIFNVEEYSGEYTKDDRFIIRTSGSTGKSKGVVLGHKALSSNAQSLIKIHNFKKGDVHASCLPLNHVNALCMSVIATHIAGAKLVYYDGNSMTEYFKFIEENNARTATIVPALLQDLCNEKPKFPKCLDYLITASAALSSELSKKFYNLYGDKIIQGYGLSEAVNFSFTMPRLKGNEFIKEYIENDPPVGLPLADVTYCIGPQDEVLIRSKSMFTRYQNNPEETSNSYILHKGKWWLKTGDIGYVRNNYLVLKGRIKDIINKGGETLYPKVIENQWLKQGVYAYAFPVKSKKLDNEIGMSCTLENYKKVKPIPAAILIDSKDFTNAKKPKRIKMSKGMQSFNFNHMEYYSMIKTALKVAKLFAGKNAVTDEAKKIANSAQKMIDEYSKYNLDLYDLYHEPIFDWMSYNLDLILNGKLTGEDFIKNNPSGWDHLMNNLMGIYPKCMDKIMQEINIKGDVLELGSGVGNLTKYISKYCEVITSDLSVNFINQFYKNKKSVRIDFNTSFDIPQNVNAVVACNALHCANDKLFTLKNIYEKMPKKAYFILGEGEKFPDGKNRWAFDYVFQLFKGWNDNTGFLTEEEWVKILKAAGFEEIRINRIRCKKDKLGFVIVCQK